MSKREDNIKLIMKAYEDYLNALKEYEEEKNNTDFSKSYKKYMEASKEYEKISKGFCNEIIREAINRVRNSRNGG